MKSLNIVVLLLIPLTNCNSDFSEQNEISLGDNKYFDGHDSLPNLNNEDEVSLLGRDTEYLKRY